MEATAVSIGKSVLNGVLSFGKSAVAEEVALQFGVQREKAFVINELEMMQSFLMVAHDEQDEHRVIRTWVKQVRDVAYDAEDSLQDFVVRMHKPSWWRIPRTLLNRRHVANQMKELRAKVEDVSQRNVRYRLIEGGSKLAKASDYSTTGAAAMFGVDEARRHAADQHPSGSRLDLAQLIMNKEASGSDQIVVIGVWGTSGTVGHTSIISEAYENPNVKLNFECRAWVRLTRAFHPKEFVQSVLKQFRAAAVGVVDVLLELEAQKTWHELAHEYGGYVNKKRYLIVLTDLSTIEEWHQIKTYLPENKLGSCIVVSTEHVEVASLCPGQESIVSELKQLSAEQTIYAFYQQSSRDLKYLSKPSSSTLRYTTENEIQEDQSNTDVDGLMIMQKRFMSTNTMKCVREAFKLIGREKEKSDIIELILEQASAHQFQVIAVWGMAGLGKTTLIKDVYQSKEINNTFAKHAFVTVLRPFKLDELLRSLALQLDAKKGAMDFAGDTQKKIVAMGIADLNEVLGRRLEGKSCLIVLDDLSSTMEWTKILPSLLAMKSSSLVIVITTRREDIAKHCCEKPMCIRLLKGLEEKYASDLFTEKVFKNKTTDLAKHYPELVQPAKLILKKCNGLPLAIVTIGGFLADQPTKTAAEWRKLNEHISVELELNPKFEAVKAVLMRSYDGLPYYLKSCFLYLSIFPEDRNVRRRRLVCRWMAEGYSQDRSVADRYFMELVERSMILPTQHSLCSIHGFDSYQIHDLIRDISIAKSMEENLVFRLEEGCSSNTQGAVRHLVISSTWEGDKRDFESAVELSRIRSLTVFGKYMPFYVSDKMRFLRVLDLEETKDLADHQLEHVGKLLHLRYFSLRGCWDISYLPDSVGNLRQLETLDIKYTGILILPKTITKLTKLRYLHAGTSRGVMMPRGIRKLKTLHTLRYVRLARGNTVVREIKTLTSLCKLAVFGINAKNGPEFCSAICTLSRLESLSLESDGADLSECLHAMSSPPENLQSLKLRGFLKRLPEWAEGLQNLVILKLEDTKLSWKGDTMQVLGNLPNLSILRLLERFLQIEEPMTFRSGFFRSLVVLEVILVDAKTKSLEFEPTTMLKLEVLRLHLYNCNAGIFGLEFLPSIKEVRLFVYFSSLVEKSKRDMSFAEADKEARRKADKIKKHIGKQLARNKNRPVLKVK